MDPTHHLALHDQLDELADICLRDLGEHGQCTVHVRRKAEANVFAFEADVVPLGKTSGGSWLLNEQAVVQPAHLRVAGVVFPVLDPQHGVVRDTARFRNGLKVALAAFQVCANGV